MNTIDILRLIFSATPILLFVLILWVNSDLQKLTKGHKALIYNFNQLKYKISMNSRILDDTEDVSDYKSPKEWYKILEQGCISLDDNGSIKANPQGGITISEQAALQRKACAKWSKEREQDLLKPPSYNKDTKVS